MVNEQCKVLIGRKYFDKFWFCRAVNPTEGSPTKVDFDVDWVLENHERVVGFYHTHPSMSAWPSDLDYSTMMQLITSLGKSLLCLIEGTELKPWIFFDNPGMEGYYDGVVLPLVNECFIVIDTTHNIHFDSET